MIRSCGDIRACLHRVHHNDKHNTIRYHGPCILKGFFTGALSCKAGQVLDQNLKQLWRNQVTTRSGATSL